MRSVRRSFREPIYSIVNVVESGQRPLRCRIAAAMRSIDALNQWGSLFTNTSRLLLAMESDVVSEVAETPVDALGKGDRR